MAIPIKRACVRMAAMALVCFWPFTGGIADDDKYASVMPVIATCEACHGEGGHSVIAQNPALGGQHFYYLYVQLKDFKAGRRENPIMGPLASGLEKADMKLIAQYFEDQGWQDREAAEEIDAATVTLAKQVINGGQCVACHLGGFEGDSRVPWSAGQHEEYLAKTLLDFKTKARNNSPSKSTLMASFSDDELKAVAKYLASLRVKTAE